MKRLIFSNFHDSLVHQLGTVGIGIIQRSGRRGIIAQHRVATGSRPGVASKTRGIIRIELIVSWNNRHSLVTLNIIHGVRRPSILTIIHMQNQQAMSIQTCIKANGLAVLQQIIFILVLFIIQNISLSIMSEIRVSSFSSTGSIHPENQRS